MKRLILLLAMIWLYITPAASIAQEIERPRFLTKLQWRVQDDLAIALGKRQEEGYGVWFYDANLQPLRMLPFLPDQATILKWSPDGTRFLMGRDIVYTETFKVVASLPSQSLSLGDWSHDSTQLLAWVDRWKTTWLGFFDVEQGMFVRQIPVKNAIGDDSVFWSPDNRYFLRPYSDKPHEIISADDGHLISKLIREDHSYMGVFSWSPDGSYLAGSLIEEVESDTPGILPDALSPMIASVAVWDILTGEIVQFFSPLHDFVTAVTWHPYKPLLAVSTSASLIYVWNTETGREITAFTLEDRVYGLTFSPFGGLLIASVSPIPDSYQAHILEQRKAFPQNDYWSQDYADGLLKVIVLDSSLENLNDIESRCVPADVMAQLPDAATDIDAYIEAVQQNEAIAPACAADLVAVAKALQDEETGNR